MVINYGIKITTGQTGITDSAIGLSAGVIQWITGRPSIAGWKEGMIVLGSISPVSQGIEITTGGSYGTMSGFSFSVTGTIGGLPAWAYLETLGLYLIQKDVRFYTYRDGVATQDWTGRIADVISTETEFKITCMDAFRAIHKPLAKPIDLQAFPSAPSATIGKSIPISIGRVTHGSLVNVETNSGKIVCATVSSVDFKFCAATEYPVSSNYRVLKLKTQDKVFAASALADMTITVIHGGASQSKRLLGNNASSGGETQVSIDTKFDVSTPFVAWTSGDSTDDVWYFEITDNSATYALSQNPIHSFTKSSAASNSFNDFVEIYKEETRTFSKILGIDFTKSTTDIDSSGYPGMTLRSKFTTTSGSSQVFTAVKPTGISITAKSVGGGLSASTDGLGAVSSNPTNLIDSDYSTGYAFTWSIANTAIAPWPASVLIVTYKITIPQDVLEEDLSDIFLLPAIHSSDPSGTPNHWTYLTVSGIDFYGRTSIPIIAEFPLNGTVDNDLVWLHDNYFTTPSGVSNQFAATGLDTVESPSLGIAKRHQFSLRSIISGAHKLGIYNSYSVTFRVYQDNAIGSEANASVSFREIGLISAYDFDYAQKEFYSKYIGELFGGTWGGRKTAANSVDNIADAVEHLIRNHDAAASAVDTTSFDLLSHPTTGTRKDWYIGRQIIDPPNSFELCEDLARFGFFGIVPKNNGTRALVAWLETGSAAATHSSTNIIQGSIGPRSTTSMAHVYNDIEVRYAWNPGSNKFDKIFKITRIDEASFPLIADPEWKTYAIGFTDAQYSTASALWTLCHASYTKYGVIQKLPDEMANAYWFPDVETDWALTATNNSALLYLTQLCNWTPFRKDMVTYQLPNTATHATLELLNRITFNDAYATASISETGYIIEKSIVPGNGLDGKDYIEVQLMLAPDKTI